MLKKVSFLALLLTLMTMLMVACSPSNAAARPPQATPTIDNNIVNNEPVSCPQATADTWQLVNPAHGYCLLYPLAYKVEKSGDLATELVIGSVMNHIDPRAFIAIEPANGRTAAEVADAIVTQLPGDLVSDWNIERSTIQVGGETAVVLDGVPGQDIRRMIFVAHDGRLYQFTFVPANQDAGEVYAQMETLYDLVIDSFRFLP